jgi:hypothetical protein
MNVILMIIFTKVFMTEKVFILKELKNQIVNSLEDGTYFKIIQNYFTDSS